jgi:TonB family protein
MSKNHVFALAVFPREFEKHLWTDLDRRLVSTFLISWLVVYTIAILLGTTRYDTEQLNRQIRNKYVSNFLATDPPPTATAAPAAQASPQDIGRQDKAKADPKAHPRQDKTAQEKNMSVREQIQKRRADAAERTAKRRIMRDEIAGTGILGVLSSGSSAGHGDAVNDALAGMPAGAGDLKEVLSRVTGLADASTADRSSRLGARGRGRTKGSADVQELFSGGIGPAVSADMGRKGHIRMALKQTSVSGAGARETYRSGEALSSVINAHNDAIEYCYKRQARLIPDLRGDITVEFTIAVNGRVTTARLLSSSLRNQAVERCILSKVRGWRFKPVGRGGGEVTVRQKYLFG